MIALERLSDGSITDRNFDKLMSLVIDTGGREIAMRFGTFSGVTSAAGEVVIPVTHGLGRTPVAVFLTPNSASSVQITARVSAVAATTFDAYVVRSAAAAVSVGGYWLAIG